MFFWTSFAVYALIPGIISIIPRPDPQRITNFRWRWNDPPESFDDDIGSVVSIRGGRKLDKKKKILILMSDTGGGHRASAEALDQALVDQFPGKLDVNIMDIWTDHANPPFNKFVPVYRFLAKYPILWRGFYAYGQFPPTKKLTEIWSWHSNYKIFSKVIKEADPDLVVSVHPLCQLMPISVVKELNAVRPATKLSIPFITVVTDLGGAHSTWFDKRVDFCFVPSDAVKNIAINCGIGGEKILLRGLPVRPSFWKPSESKISLRNSLGLKQDIRTALVMGGGDGVGGLQSIATQLIEKLGKWKNESQVVVICGHNKQVFGKLISHHWPSNVNVVVKGFAPNIDEYMAASDCLVTKAGPGTIAEAMIRGLPLIISSFLPGQVGIF